MQNRLEPLDRVENVVAMRVKSVSTENGILTAQDTEKIVSRTLG